jgi:hypothetical protein
VVHDAAGIRLGVGHVVEPSPRQVRAGQRRLDEVLGELLITGQQIRRTQQRMRPAAHERVELVLG